MRSQPLYTISIAYEYKGELVVGCVYCPPTGELFLGVKGEGATLNGKPIHVTDITDTRNAIVHMAFAHRFEVLRERTLKIIDKLVCNTSDLRRLGSCAYDLCLVASGYAEGYVELGLSLYDYAAGCVILKEAGGTITDWEPGKDCIKTGHLLASNTILHEALRELVTE
jgi:myo-inositol-1(or 4)-monophosphatase